MSMPLWIPVQISVISSVEEALYSSTGTTASAALMISLPSLYTALSISC